ncbi:UDP-glycosyltransferase 90A1-like [Lolium rigidum]|uniref:UDP-glycosyltransferase 90A1-like n=1 Tax=Lolium rigidum TaxID=89674 RepID=UPI001F5D7FF2|nr:UDP-glycosyltransferase 90A1-like [Lolium rigidum]
MAESAVSCDASPELPHVAIFPLMARGHTIPLTQLAHVLLRRRLASVTFFTTPGNAAFVRSLLPAGADVVELPFPASQGAENVEGVASASAFADFAESTLALQPRFEEALASMRPAASLLIADPFMYWTAASAAALGVPRVSFLGTSAFAHVMRESFVRDMPGFDGTGDGTYTVPEFPDVKFLLADVPPPPVSMLPLDAKMAMAVAGSRGVIMNTFDGLESRYIERWNRHIGPRAWPLGPLRLARECSADVDDHVAVNGTEPSWLQWLDEKAAAGQSVLFVALGTLLAVPEAQLREVARGLEEAQVNFLWALRSEDDSVGGLGTGFEERVRGRGMVTRGWVNQQAILQHECVAGFLSHCGWNSVLESVSAGVPLAAWPMEFDQPFNAKLVVDELRVGVSVKRSGETVREGLVKSEEISRAVREIMLGEASVPAAKNAAVLAGQARRAVSAGGSSWRMVAEMIGELCVTAEPTARATKGLVGGDKSVAWKHTKNVAAVGN